MNYLTTILSNTAIEELSLQLKQQDLDTLAKDIQYLDEYSDEGPFDQIIADWMDSQGIHYTLGDFIESYGILQKAMENRKLTTIEPYKTVVEINSILKKITSGLDTSLD